MRNADDDSILVLPDQAAEDIEHSVLGEKKVTYKSRGAETQMITYY